jgi:glycosyltransferase involved in cell wall biosynthesis
MKIGIDARLYSQAGIGRYIRNLISALAKIDLSNQYILYLKKSDFASASLLISNFKNGCFQIKIADYPWYSIKEQLLFPIQLYKDRLDLLFIPHFNAPILYFKKIAVTVHDLIMHRKERVLEVTTRAPVIYGIKRRLYKIIFSLSIYRAGVIFVPSKHIRDSLVSNFSFGIGSKIIVTPEAVDDIFLKSSNQKLTDLSKFGIRAPYILYVGSAYPHKNLKDLIISYKNAFSKLSLGMQLVILGKRDLFLGRVREFSNGLGLSDSVIFPSFVEDYGIIDDNTLISFYKNATAFVSASLEEGFNLTPLEAIACGVPCAVSGISAHHEVYKDAVLFFEPTRIDDISKALVSITCNKTLREDLLRKSNLLLSQYNWATTAKETLRGFCKV